MEEDLGARFNHKGKKIYKNKKKKLESFNRNNSRNRDIYSIAKASGKVLDVSMEEAIRTWQETYIDNNYEDKLIDIIDKKKKLE